MGPGHRRTGRQRLALAAKIIAAGLSVSVLAASGLLWWGYRHFNGEVKRVDAIVKPATPQADPDGKDQNILLVGSDDRSDATPAELRALGTQANAGNNTDTMILVHIPADGRKATAVSFPRDSYVSIPGFGKGKLNAAYADGTYGEGGKANPDRGRQLLVSTISNLTGLKIDHYVEVDLLGFYRISNAIGGVQVCLKAAQKDPYSGIDLPAGKQTIQGSQALAFVRQRHGLPRGDLDRIARQQYFLSATFRKITSAGVLANPIKLKNLLDAIGKSLRMDSSLDPLKLARQVHSLAAGNVQFMTVPNKGSATVNGASVIMLDDAALPAFFTKFISGSSATAAGTATKTLSPSQVSVSVRNAAGRKGLATQTKTALTAAGFTVTDTGNAAARTATVIGYSAGNQAAAATLAKVVPGATLVQEAGLGNTVQLVLGSSFTGIGSGAAAAAPTAAAAASTASAPTRSAADASCIN